jgi:hypothetical protein
MTQRSGIGLAVASKLPMLRTFAAFLCFCFALIASAKLAETHVYVDQA